MENDYVPVILGVGSDAFGSLTVTNEGSITAHQLVVGRGSGTGDGKLYIIGGTMDVDGSVDIGVGGNKGEVVISDNGFLHLYYSPSFAPDTNNVSVIKILDTSTLWIDGDQTPYNFVGDGFITTTDSMSLVKEVYNSTYDRTEYTVVPEPVTLGLISFIGLAFLRRR